MEYSLKYVILALFFIGCNSVPDKVSPLKEFKHYDRGFHILDIQGHDYILFVSGGSSYQLEHFAGCKAKHINL